MNNRKRLKKREVSNINMTTSSNNRQKKIVVVIIMLIVILSLIFIGFSYFSPIILEDTTYNTSGAASDNSPSIVFTDLSNGINLTSTYPMTNEEGLTQNPYSFRITNNETNKIIYEVYLQTESGNTVTNNLVSVSLNNSAPAVLNTFRAQTPDSGYSYNYKISSGVMNASASKDFSLRVWFNEDGTIATVQNKNWYGKIFVKARFANNLGTDKIMNLVAGEPTNTTNVITKPAPEGATCTNTLAYDGTSDNNLRYVGANPCNYVTFNGETAGWRIVGIMNNVDDGTGNLETRIKLVRKDYLGIYSWDTSESSVNSGYGVNDWTQADLKNELNGDYLNTSLNANTNWYNGRNNAQTGVFDYTKRLSASAQNLIGDAKWYLGGFANNNANLITNTMYTLERGTTVWGSTSGQTCNDGACPRATEWTGKVAIIYPSDYGYATAGGTTTNRNTCIGTLSTYYNTSGETWNNSSYSDCDSNDWVPYQWALPPYSSTPYSAFYVSSTSVTTRLTYDGGGPVCPAVYLQSGVTISGGNGTQSEPYVLE